MKKKQVSCATVFIAVVFTMVGCVKNKEENSCRTCKAKNAYTNSVIETKQVCSDQEEADFKFKYNSYPTIATCE